MSARPSPLAVLRRIRPAERTMLIALGVARAVGLVLTADGLAQAIVTASAGHLAAAGPMEAAVGVVVRAVAVWATIAVTAGAAAGVKDTLRRSLLATLLPGRPRVGAMTALLSTGLDDLDAYYGTYLPALVAAAVVPPLVGLRILVADPISAGILILTVPLVPVFLALIGLHTRDKVAAATDALARLSDHLVELARGLPVLVGLGRFEAQSTALRRISDEHRTRSLEVLRTAFLSSLALELLSTISVALVAVLVGLRLLAGDLTLEAGLVALVLAPECFAPIRDVGAAFHASRAGEEVEQRIRRLLGTPARPQTVTAAETVVSHLAIRHSGRPEPAVADLSFTVPAGSVVLLAGPSGTGKSTVLDVLAGRGAMLDPDARVTGSIARPESVAYVPQHVRTVGSDVLSELRAYGSADPLPVLARLGIAGLAEADPAECSPGELRRIAVARAAVRVAGGARLALIDEPTASLDVPAAQAVRREIRRMAQSAAVVLVSHDPATMALADRVVPLGGVASPAAESQAAEVRPSASRVRDAEPVGPAARELPAVLRPAAGAFAGGAALGLLAAVASVALLGVSGWLIVRAAEHPPVLTLTVAMVGVRAFGIGRAALRYAERLVTHSAVFRAVTELRLRLWAGIALRGPVSRALLRPGAALDRLVGDADRVRDLVPRTLAPLGTAVLASAAATVALLLLNGPAGVVLGIASVAALLVAALSTLLSGRAARSADGLRSLTARRTADLLAAADDLVGNGVDGPLQQSVARTGQEADRAAVRASRLSGIGSAAAVLTTGLAAVGALIAAAPAAAAGLPAPVLAVLAFVPLALGDALTEGAAGAARMPQLTAVLRRVAAVTADRAPEAEPPAPATARVDRLGLERVTARHAGSVLPVFADLSADVRRGDVLLVSGPSGSGKSTLLAVLLRYLGPAAGRVLLNGVDAATLAPAAVRHRIAWCPQEAHLFDSTLRGNLRLARGAEDAPDDDELRDALRRVGLGELLAGLPAGLDTPIGPGGAFLSGGQRQRLAVARTLLARADVVLLDEPTAHLDRPAADALMADLRAALADRIVVVVTHDEALERPDDLVLRLGADRALIAA